MSDRRTLTYEEWRAEGVRRFGEDVFRWRFVCPSCGHIASIGDWKKAGANEGMVAFSCIGRNLGAKAEICAKKGPCNYAGAGLFRLNPVDVVLENGNTRQTFEFAEAT